MSAYELGENFLDWLEDKAEPITPKRVWSYVDLSRGKKAVWTRKHNAFLKACQNEGSQPDKVMQSIRNNRYDWPE